MIATLYFILIAGLSEAMVLFWIYQTDVIPEYLELLILKLTPKKFYDKLQGTLFIEAWFSKRNESNYLEFLAKIYNKSFFIKMITCPICFSFWLSTFICILYNQLMMIPVVSFISLLFYFQLKNWIFPTK